MSSTNLEDMFSRDPVLREQWLCNLTTFRDMKRFLRQVCVYGYGWCVLVCCGCVSLKPDK